MTKFLQSSFQVGGSTEKYRKGWEKVFGERGEEEVIKDPREYWREQVGAGRISGKKRTKPDGDSQRSG